MKPLSILITIFFYCITSNMNGQIKDSSTIEKKSTSLKYDLKIQLKEIRVIQTCEIDGREDLHGNQIVYKVVSTLNDENRNLLTQTYFLWDTQRSKNISRRSGQKIQMHKKIVEIPNLTLDEIKNLEIWFSGNIYDYELLYSVKYNCLECSEPQQNPNIRVFDINNSNTRINEIEGLIPNNQYIPLTVGDDKILELNYEEGFSNCISKVKAIYEVSAKAH
jgi:hypothetical protein